jgi:uncharacterized protein (UPF0335 family)
MTVDSTVEETAKEFLERWIALENELDLLKEDKKQLKAEYKDKLDLKTMQAAIRIAKIKAKVDHIDTLDEFVDIVEG